MIADGQRKLIAKSWRLVVPIAETAADLFYRRLFELKPEYRALFPEDMARQKTKLVKMLSFIVSANRWEPAQWKDEVDTSEDLFLVVAALGHRHSHLYKIPDEGYDAVGAALIWTLEQGLGEAFTPDIRDAWARLYGLLANTMRLSGQARRMAYKELRVEAQA